MKCKHISLWGQREKDTNKKFWNLEAEWQMENDLAAGRRLSTSRGKTKEQPHLRAALLKGSWITAPGNSRSRSKDGSKTSALIERCLEIDSLLHSAQLGTCPSPILARHWGLTILWNEDTCHSLRQRHLPGISSHSERWEPSLSWTT